MPEVSIIISTYNRSHKLKRAINSILNQTFQDFEIIIVDDGSKDDTEQVVKSYTDPRIKYLKRKKNFGNDTKPKNEGIMASEGKYIGFLDDDNEYRPDHIAILLKTMRENPRLDVTYGDRWVVSDYGMKEKISTLGFSRDYDPAFLMQRNFIDPSEVLIKRQALFDVGGFDERPINNKYIDWNLWIRMSKAGKFFQRTKGVITNYYLHKDQKSRRVKTKGDKFDDPDNITFVPQWDPYDIEVVMPYLGNTIVPPKVAIYTLTYDRLGYTKKSFKSLLKTAGYLYDHFVVDNGSTDGTQKWLKGHIDPDKLILNENNKGISMASNQALELIRGAKKYDIVVKWDNDCMGLTKNWLSKMVELWKVNHMLALSCYVQGLMDNPGGTPRLDYGTIKGELLGLVKHLGGICVFTDIHAYDGFEWDEESFLHGIQDMEFSQHLVFHRYTLAYLENYFVSHGPLGTAQQKKDYPSYFERRVKEKQTRYDKNKQSPDQH